MKPLERLFVWVFMSWALLGFCGCYHDKTQQMSLSASSHQELVRNESLRVDVEKKADIDQRHIDTREPGERVDKTWALEPDGGTFLQHESTVRWGQRKVEDWQKTELGSDEHLSFDAGEVEKSDTSIDAGFKSEDKGGAAASCAFGGYLWALAIFAIAVAVLRVARGKFF